MSVLRDSSSTGGAISGVLNNSHHPVRAVELLVRHQWLWKNARHPGSDNPGRADRFSVPAEIAPGGAMPFSYGPSPALPTRDDGRFRTWVEVMGFTEVGK